MEGGLLYFGYASNLLKQRLQLINPKVEFVATAKLKDYRLSFQNTDLYSNRWHGAGATITADPGKHVWGVVWRLAAKDRPDLDIREGVSTGVYGSLYVNVISPSGEDLKCLTYELVQRTSSAGLPSPHYLDVLVRGAKQNSLPPEYVKFLEGYGTNGYEGTVEAYNDTIRGLDT